MYLTISWQIFLTTYLILTAGYCAVIVVRYYRAEIKQFFLRMTRSGASPDPADLPFEQKLDPFSASAVLVEKLKTAISSASYKRSPKEELYQAIQSVLKDYSFLKTTPFRAAINNLIETSCITDCAIHPGENEIDQLWLG